MSTYNHKQIEANWRDNWYKDNIYEAIDFSEKPKKYILAELPYPSGKYLHAGHMMRYTVPEIYSRFLRMKGFNVLFPMGWDSFGLPAETFAIKEGITPQEAIAQAEVDFKHAMQKMGYAIDWSREINTCDPAYYKWTQWMFIKLWEKGLAYQKEMPVWWCEELGVLADEEVLTEPDGTKVSERDKHPVIKKNFKQWVLNIPAYAEKLLDGLAHVDYMDSVRQGQINWIGKSEGIVIKYQVVDSDDVIECFTTRPDTNFGATFIVLAPEHPFAQKIDSPEVQAYIKQSASRSELERLTDDKAKTGVFTGFYVLNKLNNKKLPVWISDYVLGHYGTGAVVGVPAHDKRDYDFAKSFNIEIVKVIEAPSDFTGEIFVDYGTVINSDFLNGKSSEEAISLIADYIEKNNLGYKKTTYKIRDQIFSRQRYWGEPIPLIYKQNGEIEALPEDKLPLELPVMKDFLPDEKGVSPLARNTDWNTTVDKAGNPAKRETETMPTWAGSNWYYIRYIDPKNEIEFASTDKMKYWLPVDKYFGDAGHTTAHLIYTRFWVKALHDMGHIPVPEPIMWRMSGGMLLGSDNKKMSKSRPEYTINPEYVIENYGADAIRICFAFLGPYEDTYPWNERSLKACFKLASTIYQLKSKVKDENNDALTLEINKTLVAITPMLENLRMNTAVSEIMKFTNILKKETVIPTTIWKTFIKVFAPFMPFLAEELWQDINGNTAWNKQSSVHLQDWPQADTSLLSTQKVIIPITINGKRRDQIEIDIDLDEAAVKELAVSCSNVKRYLEENKAKQIIYVRGKIVNIVV